MMLRLFIDSSVLFTMCDSETGASSELVKLAEQKLVRLITSDYAFEEAANNLGKKKPRSIQVLRILKEKTLWERVMPSSQDVEDAIPHVADVFDAPIIAAAKQSQVDALVSFDRKHLYILAVSKFINAPVITAGQALQMVRLQ